MPELTTYSLLIAWNDDDENEGEFGTTVRAPDVESAERMARELMATCDDSPFDPEDPPGGRVIECQEGAMWRASELEAALRALFAEVKGRQAVLSGERPSLDAAMAKASAVLSELDALPVYVPEEQSP